MVDLHLGTLPHWRHLWIYESRLGYISQHLRDFHTNGQTFRFLSVLLVELRQYLLWGGCSMVPAFAIKILSICVLLMLVVQGQGRARKVLFIPLIAIVISAVTVPQASFFYPRQLILVLRLQGPQRQAAKSVPKARSVEVNI